MSWERVNTQAIIISSGEDKILVPNPKQKGTADYKVTVPLTRGSRIIWLETKKLKGGIQSPHQKFFEYRVKRQGQEYYLISGNTESIKEIILRDTPN
jgi:hypothetical protein